MIHGNSSNQNIFSFQKEAPFTHLYRMITFDLPGHGESSDALDPYRTYTLPGLADATLELLAALGVVDPIVFGWSLGGHIAVELLSRLRRCGHCCLPVLLQSVNVTAETISAKGTACLRVSPAKTSGHRRMLRSSSGQF